MVRLSILELIPICSQMDAIALHLLLQIMGLGVYHQIIATAKWNEN
jgi:hypothetical protein